MFPWLETEEPQSAVHSFSRRRSQHPPPLLHSRKPLCYGLNACVPQIHMLKPSGMAFGGRAPRMGLAPSEEEGRASHLSPHCVGDTPRRQPPVNKEEAQTSSLENCEKLMPVHTLGPWHSVISGPLQDGGWGSGWWDCCEAAGELGGGVKGPAAGGHRSAVPPGCGT